MLSNKTKKSLLEQLDGCYVEVVFNFEKDLIKKGKVKKVQDKQHKFELITKNEKIIPIFLNKVVVVFPHVLTIICDKNDLKSQLLFLIQDMDIPEKRLRLYKKDIKWLNRNLGFRNSNHPDYPVAMNIIKEILK